MSGPELFEAVTEFATDAAIVGKLFQAGSAIVRNATIRNISPSEYLAELSRETGSSIPQSARELVDLVERCPNEFGITSGIARAEQATATGIEATRLVQSKRTVEVAAVAEKTGTVWDSIKPTQPFYPDTKIPKSFEIHLENGKFWVHPNATKHMVEYLQAKPPSFSMPINSQSMLTDFSNAANMAIKNGVTYNTEVIVGKWEFIFSPPHSEGLLPVIHHALYKP